MKLIWLRKNRRGKRGAPKVSLFPFLAVLICTMGALVLLLLDVTREARLQAVRIAAAKNAEKRVSVGTERENVRWRIEQLAKSRKETQSQLNDARLLLGHIEDHSRRLRTRLAELSRTAQEIEGKGMVASQAQYATQDEIRRVEAQIAEASQRVEEAKKAVDKRPRSYAIIPYEGPNQTHRRPIYIECRADAVVLQPENVIFTEADFDGPMGEGNPLAVALRAAREHMLAEGRIDPRHGGEPYPLLIVRPSGIAAYLAARAAMKSWDTDFGYELVSEDWQLQFPQPDPGLAQVVQQSVGVARVRQQSLIAASPGLYGKRAGRGTYRVAATGVVREGGSEEDEDGGGFYSPRPAGKFGSAVGGAGQGGGGTGTNAGGLGAAGTGNGGSGNPYTVPGTQYAGTGGFNAPGGNGAGQGGGGGTGPGAGTGVPGGIGNPYSVPSTQYAVPGSQYAGPGNQYSGIGSGVGLGGGTGTGAGGLGTAGSGNGGSGNPYAVPGTQYAVPGTQYAVPGTQYSVSSTQYTGTGGGAGQGGGTGGGGLGTAGSGNGGSGNPYAVPSTPYSVPGTQSTAPGVSGTGGSGATASGPVERPDGYVVGRPADGTPPVRDPSAVAGGQPAAPLRPGEWHSSDEFAPPKKDDKDDRDEKKDKEKNLADKRGHDWGLRDAAHGAQAVTRPIHVDCFPDRLVIVGEAGYSDTRTIVTGARPEQSIDKFISATWEHMDSWGIAGKGLYWRPMLNVYVKPGAEPQFETLKALLKGSGLNIERKQ